MDKVQ
jgi:hypothetical protein